MSNLRFPRGTSGDPPDQKDRKPSRLQSLLKPQYLIPAVTAGLVAAAIINVTWNRIASRIRLVLDEHALSLPPEKAIQHFRNNLLAVIDKEFTEIQDGGDSDNNYFKWERPCDVGEKYQELGEEEKAEQAFKQCKDGMPQDTNIMEQIKVYSKLQDNKKDGIADLGKAENYGKVRELLQKFIGGVLTGDIIVWEETMDDFREAYSQYESPEKVKQTLIELGDALMSQIKDPSNNNNVSPAKRCYELAGMDEDEIYLRLAKEAFRAGKISNASWFFETATEGQCVEGSEEMKALARSIAQQYLYVSKYPEGAKKVLSAAGIDKKEIAGILAEYTLALPFKYLECEIPGYVDADKFLPSKYREAKNLLRESGIPDEEILKTLAVQAEKDNTFEVAAVLYEKLKDTEKAQENFAKAAERERNMELRIYFFKKAGLKKEAKATTEEHKEAVTEKAQKEMKAGNVKEAALTYLSICDTASARKIAKDLAGKVEVEKDKFKSDEIEDIADLCNAVKDINNRNKLLKTLVDRIIAKKPADVDFFKLTELYEKMGYDTASKFAHTMGLRQSRTEILEHTFANPDTSVDDAVGAFSCLTLHACGIDPSPQTTLTTVARRFFDAKNFSQAALAFHALGDNIGLNASLEALGKECEEDKSPSRYRNLADIYKAIEEEDLAKQYYLFTAQSYLEEAQEYSSGNADAYEAAAECYVLAGEKDPPNNPALLACIQSVKENFKEDDDDEAVHNGVHKCVNKLGTIINLTKEEAESLLGRTAESQRLYREATVHYTDAGMPYEVGRVHARQASDLEQYTDRNDYLHYYQDASGHYENAGDLDGALRTSVKALAQARRKEHSSSEVRELQRILALLQAKKSFYVQEFPGEE